MNTYPSDTIAALATASGGGVGILRISGALAQQVARVHFSRLPELLEPRRMYFGQWRTACGEVLDEGLLVFFSGPASYTGEDVIEVHLHGGALSLNRCLEVLWAHDVRPAEPGEFTRRAFLNGRLDLTKAEAIADLISAQTDRALAQARQHLQGKLFNKADAAKELLISVRARIEVNIDFIEEDVPLQSSEQIVSELVPLKVSLRELAGTCRAGQLWQHGARVVLAGVPNAGKSSLFNALCGSERAIVSPHPGTTRDTIEASVDLKGVPVVLVDTAGIRQTADAVEAAGVVRAEQQLASADLVLEVIDGLVPSGTDETTASIPEVSGVPCLRVSSKRDLVKDLPGDERLAVSAHTGEGLESLIEAIVERLGGHAGGQASLTIGRQRHRVALERAASALDDAVTNLEQGAPPELVAVDIQEACDALDDLVGATTIEDVLDRLFGDFCIGK